MKITMKETPRAGHFSPDTLADRTIVRRLYEAWERDSLVFSRDEFPALAVRLAEKFPELLLTFRERVSGDGYSTVYGGRGVFILTEEGIQ